MTSSVRARITVLSRTLPEIRTTSAAALICCSGSLRERARLTLAPALFALLSLAWLAVGFDRLHGAVTEPQLAQIRAANTRDFQRFGIDL